MRIRRGNDIAIGPGKVDLLAAIHEHGSISAAARHLGMSYRRAWLLVDQLNRCLQGPATVSSHGGSAGGSCLLTPVGLDVIRLYRDIENTARTSCETQISELTALMRSPEAGGAHEVPSAKD
jgi:molybdate transport system regulatory protein